jgi:hypothetical protein
MAARDGLTHPTHTSSISVSDSARNSAAEMSKYFGPLRNSDIETFASDAFAHETHNLPKAYEGRNKFLMATIDFLITKDDDWYTRYVLPWLYTEEIHVKWNIWRFNRTMMDYEPEQGVPRYVSYESESRSDSLVRRGLAFIIEHGFYKTEIGRQHYLMNLKQIVEAVHETVYFGVMHELIACPNFYEQWQKKHGRPNSISTNNAVSTLAEERWRFACIQKDIKGLFVLDAEIKDRMRRVGIEPDSWIFPSKMAIYASMVPEYFNEYHRGGAPATNALEVGAKRFDTFRGNRVFETRSFDTDFMAAEAVEPLVRHRQIGEYYVLGEGRSDFTRGIQVFDMSRDKFTTVTYTDALKDSQKDMSGKGESGTLAAICMHWHNKLTSEAKPNPTVRDTINSAFHMDASTDDLTNASRCAEWGKGAPQINGVAGETITFAVNPLPDAAFPTGVTRECHAFLRAQVKRHGTAHSDIVNSDGSVVGRGGPPVAGNNIGPANGWRDNSTSIFECRLDRPFPAAFEQGHTNQNSQDQNALLAMFDAHGVSFVPHSVLMFRPRITYRMATAMLLKGGEELGQTLHGHHDFQLTDDVIHKTHIGHYTFYSKSVVREPKLVYHAEDIYCCGYDGGENTKFIKDPHTEIIGSTVDENSSSILSIMIPYGEPLSACLSVVGDLDRSNITIADQGDYPTSEIMRRALEGVINYSPQTSFISPVDNEVLMNGICFRGAEHEFHEKDGEWKQRQQNTGHWGPNVYDGCGMVRMGMYAHLKTL